MGEPFWTDGAGRKWRLPDMEDRHLRNAILMMRKTVQSGEGYIARLRMFSGGDDEDGLESLTEQNEIKLGLARNKLAQLESELTRRRADTLQNKDQTDE